MNIGITNYYHVDEYIDMYASFILDQRYLTFYKLL